MRRRVDSAFRVRVIETRGVEEFDSRDRAFVWRTFGGKHRYFLGDCSALVEDDLQEFRKALLGFAALNNPLTLEAMEREHAKLSRRLETFGALSDGLDVWRALGWLQPENVSLAPTEVFLEQARALRAA
jgi:malonate decarboxylase beta subunit